MFSMFFSSPEHSAFFLFIFFAPAQDWPMSGLGILTWFLVTHFGLLGVHLDFSLCEKATKPQDKTPDLQSLSQ